MNVARTTVLAATLALLAPLCHAQETAPLNPANMNKTGMLPPHTKVLGERAVAAFAKKDWPAARKAYQEMLELDDGTALVHRKPRLGEENRPRFGNTVARLPLSTPNHVARVAKY